MTDTTTATDEPVFDTTTAAGRLRILWGATADPDLAMSDDDVADVATVLREHAEMATELEGLRVACDAAYDKLESMRAQLLTIAAERDAANVEAERLRAEQEPAREGHGPGVPGAMHLEAFGQSIADAFGDCPYHVGSSATSKNWRDVDVRLILHDDRFHALFPGFANAHHIDAWWSLLCAALSELGAKRTGLPIDFQIQPMTEANEKYNGIRNPLFLIRTKDEHRPAMVGPRREVGGGGGDA